MTLSLLILLIYKNSTGSSSYLTNWWWRRSADTFIFYYKFSWSTPTIYYNREELLHIGRTWQVPIRSAFQHSTRNSQSTGVPMECYTKRPRRQRRERQQKPRRRRRERRQEGVCRSGNLARLKRAPNRPPMRSLFLRNARSLGNKMDKLKFDISTRSTIGDSLCSSSLNAGYTQGSRLLQSS